MKSDSNAGGSATAGPRSLRFRIGVVDVSIESDLQEALSDFADLYAPFRQDRHDGEAHVQMRVDVKKRTLWGSRRYTVQGNDRKLGSSLKREEVVPYLEWGINWSVIEKHRQFVQLHAGSMARDGQGLILPAQSGSGKSTLCAALLRRGWKYLSDEFALIEPHSLKLQPFPKALCIKQGAFGVLERLGLSPWKRRYFIKALKGQVGYLRPHDVARRPIAKPSPIRFVVFPKYRGQTVPRLFPLSRARAALALAGCTLKRDPMDGRTSAVLADVVRGATCFRLDSGDIEKTCDLIDRLFDRTRATRVA